MARAFLIELRDDGNIAARVYHSSGDQVDYDQTTLATAIDLEAVLAEFNKLHGAATDKLEQVYSSKLDSIRAIAAAEPAKP